MNFFSDALRQAMQSRHFNQAQLAEFLGVDPAYVSRWLKGSSPRLDQMKAVLNSLGWELDRARPDYDPFEDAIGQLSEDEDGQKVRTGTKAYKDLKDIRHLLKGAADAHRRQSHPPVSLTGRLTANDALIHFDRNEAEEVYESLTTLFSPVEFADNELSMLLVEGNELTPLHPNGSRLLIRRVLKPASVPDGCEVVLETNRKQGIYELRRLIRVTDRKTGRIDRLIGAPLSVSQDYLFFKPREARMHSVVVGAIVDSLPA